MFNSINIFDRTFNNKGLFCHQYWQRVLKNNKAIPNAGRFDFNDANYELMGISNNYCEHLTSLIKNNDLSLKLSSKPIKYDIVLWRGIANPNIYKEKSKYLEDKFKKCSNLKEGDVFYMPEYSFWSESKTEAINYAAQNGIIYELKIPKGTNIFEKIYPIFKRASKFLCINNTEIKKDNSKLNHIKLKLLPRDIVI